MAPRAAIAGKGSSPSTSLQAGAEGSQASSSTSPPPAAAPANGGLGIDHALRKRKRDTAEIVEVAARRGMKDEAMVRGRLEQVRWYGEVHTHFSSHSFMSLLGH